MSRTFAVDLKYLTYFGLGSIPGRTARGNRTESASRCPLPRLPVVNLFSKLGSTFRLAKSPTWSSQGFQSYFWHLVFQQNTLRLHHSFFHLLRKNSRRLCRYYGSPRQELNPALYSIYLSGYHNTAPIQGTCHFLTDHQRWRCIRL